MRKSLTLLPVFFYFSLSVSAQKISGNIKDQQGKSLDKTTVSLLHAKDSIAVKFVATDKSGFFSFTAAAPGTYLVHATSVGHQPIYSAPFILNETDIIVPELIMKKAEKLLEGVVVTSKKPMVEVKADKTILNVEGTINATGSDALDLIRKSPGVLVDKDDNISLAGKNGVQIYVDGKPTPLSGSDLANYLKTLQSSQIEAIEIITNPSAKYDAAGNAGIINIKLKKNKAFGTNGSVNAGYSIGVFPKYNAGIALNNRTKNVNLFGNYNYNKSRNYNNFKLFREQLDTLFDQKSIIDFRNNSHGFKVGADYYASKKSTIGVLLNGNLSDNELNTDSKTPIIYKPSGITDRLLVAENRNKMKQTNLNSNLNYRYADTLGRELNFDADYGYFRLDGNQLQPNYYYNPSGQNLLSKAIYRFISPTDIDIYTMKGDYEQNFEKGRLGIGFKLSVIETENKFERYNVEQLKPEISSLDVNRSNQFNYCEKINAGYINYNRQFKGIMMQAGVRLENTSSTGNSYGLNSDGTVNKNSKQTFKRKYTDLFPSAALSFNKNPMSQLGISYSRRIDRPAYQDLNPFEFKLDEYTYMKGNTQLRPQYTNIVSVTHTYKFKLTTKLSYSHVKDIFTMLVDTAEESKSFMTKKNLARQDVTSLNISYPFMYKNYTAFVNFNGNYSSYTADFGGGNRVVNLDVFSFNIYMQHSMKLGKKKGWTAEVSGWYNSPSIWGGTFESKALWTLDAGVQKNIFNGRGLLKVAVSDVFFTMKWKGESNFAGQKVIASGYQEGQVLKTSLTWRFGSNQVKAARQRKAASEDELKRTQSSGGIGQ